MFTVLAISILIANLTFGLSKSQLFGAIRASAIVTIISMLCLSFLEPADIDFYSSLVFGATFVGMCSHHRFNLLQVNTAAIIFSFTFIFLTPYISTFGGALGFSAFISVCFVILTQKLFLSLYRSTKNSA